MAIETDDDRHIFIDSDDFAVRAIWTTSAGPQPEISVIFDDTFLSLQAAEMEFGQEGGRIQVMAVSSDVPSGAKKGDTLVVDDRSYKVFEFQPDGTGMTTVRLQEQ